MKDPRRAAKRCGGACPEAGKRAVWPVLRGWRRFLFPLIGLIALFWFLVRVIPKPSRAAYPCQRIAAPVASSFVVWLISIAGAAVAFHNARYLFRKSRYVIALLCVLAGISAGIFTMTGVPGANAGPPWTPTEPANSPMGVAKGVYPGRVTWIHDANATAWNGITGYWWEGVNTSQSAVDSMMSKTVRWLAGENTDQGAWDAIFRNFNQSHGRGNVGYQANEKITIKLNLNCFDKINGQNPAPQTINALLGQLVNSAGVAQTNITVCDPSRTIPTQILDSCRGNFPNVRFVDCYGANGSSQAQPDTNASAAVYYSNTNVWGNGVRYPEKSFTEAAYVISLGCLRGHNLAGVTICAKNFFGSTWVNYDTNQFHRGWTPGGADTNGNPCMNGMHGWIAVNNFSWGGGWDFVQRPMGSYNALVDIMGNKDLGGKTVLFLADGLYAQEHQSSSFPFKWQTPPFNNDWSSSLIASLDGVAIESVCLDFLRSEPGYTNVVQGTADNYLHEAALANNPPSGTLYDPNRTGTNMPSLGVHEHWNNSTDRQYTGNLGAGNGIELISRPPTLTVASGYGTANPPAGVHTNEFKTVLTNALAGSPFTQGQTQYVCTGWTLACKGLTSGAGTSMNMTLTNDAVLTWQWATNYRLDTVASGSGTVSVASGWFTPASNVTISATASPYYRLASWSGNTNGCVIGAGEITVPMDGPRQITANFEQNIAPKGTPESWLAGHGLTNSAPDVEELKDGDYDGSLNWQEWAAGTDPTNDMSVFRIMDIAAPSSGRLPLTFTSVSGRTYRLWGMPVLDTSAWALVQYATNDIGGLVLDPVTANVETITIFVAPSGTSMFYRVKLF